MKITALITLVVLSGTLAPAHAQVVTPRLGLFGAVTSSTIAWKPDPGFDVGRLYRPGVGVSVDVPFTQRVSLDVRGLYNTKGAASDLSTAPRSDVRVTLGYLSFPALLKYTGAGRVRPYVMAGPELSIKTDARYRLRVGDDVDAGALERNEIGRLDYGVTAGAGVAAGRVFIEGLYSQGFRDVGELREGQEQDLKTRALSVLAGIRF